MTHPDVDSEKKLNEHRLTMLMDYTKFHIGLYATLITALLAVANLGGESYVTPELRQWLHLPICLVLLAGMCGGIIAANLPEQKSFDLFWNGSTGPWGMEFMPTRCVARAEHFFFWTAVVSGILVTMWFGGPPQAELEAKAKTQQAAPPQPPPDVPVHGERGRPTVPLRAGSAPAPSDSD